MKFKGTLLKFDVPDKNGVIFSSEGFDMSEFKDALENNKVEFTHNIGNFKIMVDECIPGDEAYLVSGHLEQPVDVVGLKNLGLENGIDSKYLTAHWDMHNPAALFPSSPHMNGHIGIDIRTHRPWHKRFKTWIIRTHREIMRDMDNLLNE